MDKLMDYIVCAMLLCSFLILAKFTYNVLTKDENCTFNYVHGNGEVITLTGKRL
jgi:hypothetical protein